jgi:flavin reductase ActVB
MSDTQSIEDQAGELRRTIARVPAPVTLVTTYAGDEPVGFTASSFVNISVDPPLVGVFVADSSRSRVHFEAAEHVAINFLSLEQSEVATVFATRGARDRFDSVQLDPEHGLAPVVEGAFAAVVGRVVQRPEMGDHLMLVIEVDRALQRQFAPLVYQDRTFRSLVDIT